MCYLVLRSVVGQINDRPLARSIKRTRARGGGVARDRRGSRAGPYIEVHRPTHE